MFQLLYSAIRDPLCHFILLGGFLFAVFKGLAPPESAHESAHDEEVIEITQEALLNFMMYRANAYDPAPFLERLEGMDEELREVIVNDYIRDETLYREGVAMGLDKEDYMVRQRVVQKLSLLLENSIAKTVEPSTQAIEDYYETNLAEYQVDTVYNFVHVYFSKEKHGLAGAQQQAQAFLAGLREQAVSYNDAKGLGDVYPFLQYYVERTWDFVRLNFDQGFTESLDLLEPSEEKWYGPFQTDYGFHVVMLHGKQDAYIPELSSILNKVTEDYRFELISLKSKELENEIMTRYPVEFQ